MRQGWEAHSRHTGISKATYTSCVRLEKEPDTSPVRALPLRSTTASCCSVLMNDGMVPVSLLFPNIKPLRARHTAHRHISGTTSARKPHTRPKRPHAHTRRHD